MSDLEAAAASAGVPEELIQRAAAARAQASGVAVDDILKAWAGGAAPPPGDVTSAAETPDSSVQAPADPAAPISEEVVDAGEPTATPGPTETAVTDAPPAVPAGFDVPASVGVDDATSWPVVTTVQSADLKERTVTVVPRWLMSVFVVVPFFALGYLLVFTNGAECGDAGQLQVDRFGQVINCDGSPFEGKASATAGLVDYFGIGADVYARAGSCAGCHGSNGEGGAGPAFAGGAVTAVFSVCEDHVSWVRLGTLAYGTEVGSTYGDTAKAVGGGGVMPGFGQLTEEELRGVVVYERGRFGGEEEAVSLLECGLVTPADDAPGEDAPTTNPGEGLEAGAGRGS